MLHKSPKWYVIVHVYIDVFPEKGFAHFYRSNFQEYMITRASLIEMLKKFCHFVMISYLDKGYRKTLH